MSLNAFNCIVYGINIFLCFYLKITALSFSVAFAKCELLHCRSNNKFQLLPSHSNLDHTGTIIAVDLLFLMKRYVQETWNMFSVYVKLSDPFVLDHLGVDGSDKLKASTLSNLTNCRFVFVTWKINPKKVLLIFWKYITDMESAVPKSGCL